MSGSDRREPERGDSGRLTVSAPGALISVVDSGYQSVADAPGRLSVELPAGAYRATAAVGGISQSRLAVVRVGMDTSLDLPVSFPAAAPVAGTAWTEHSHQELARTITREVSQAADGPPSALVLVLRDLPGQSGTQTRPSTLRVSGGELRIFDGEMRPVAWQPGDWKHDREASAAAWGKRLNPGGYILRMTSRTGPEDTSRPAGMLATDQAVWLSPGWMTVVFVPSGPAGPRSVATSVQMVNIDSCWEPSAVQAFASEAVLAGLRAGVAAVEDRQLHDLLHAKFVNPMLGVLGGHALVQQMETADDPAVARERLRVLKAVVSNLSELISDHPDVAALRAVTCMADGRASNVSVTWPPMLTASLRELISAGRADSSILPPGTPAEHVSARRVIGGPWLLWEPTSALALEGKVRYSRLGVRLSEFSGGVRERKAAPPDDAVQRCERHLTQASRLLGRPMLTVAEELGSAELSQRLTMPESLVKAAVEELALKNSGEEIVPFEQTHKSWAWHRPGAHQESAKLREQDRWAYGQIVRALERLTAESGSELGQPGRGRIRQLSAAAGEFNWIVLFVERRDVNGLGGLVLQRSGKGHRALPDSCYQTARRRLSEMHGW